MLSEATVYRLRVPVDTVDEWYGHAASPAIRLSERGDGGGVVHSAVEGRRVQYVGADGAQPLLGDPDPGGVAGGHGHGVADVQGRADELPAGAAGEQVAA